MCDSSPVFIGFLNDVNVIN